MRQQLNVAAPPPSPWKVTGDSIMAICLVETLDRCGEVNRDLLAQGLGERYLGDPKRGYGRVIRAILRQLSKGVPWPKAAGSAFGGLGSMGNGAAVRAAPVGAYFSDRIDEVIEQARRSAEVTHAHAEAQAGAVAIALAAAWAAAHEGSLTLTSGAELLAFCAEFTPTGATREGLNRTRTLSFGAPVDLAARTLGNGSQLTAPDTVPFALWCAARHLDNCRQALWTAVRGLGDCDTNCAITGGIVVLSAGLASLPGDWLGAREPLPVGSSAIRFSPRV